MALPEDERIDMAAALLESVEPEPLDEGASSALSAEARRRLEEIQSGAVKPVPKDEAERLLFEADLLV